MKVVLIENPKFIAAFTIVLQFAVLYPLLFLLYYKCLNKQNGLRLSGAFKKSQRSKGWLFKWIVITIGVSQKETLTATLTPTNSATYCSWSSSDDTVAAVTSGGVVTGKKVGTAVITVKTTNGKTATCTVTVKKAPTAVTLDKTELSIKVGETYTLKKTLTPSNAATSYTYTSSKTAVATVTSSGKIVAKKAGTAVITVTTHNGKTATCTVTVK